MKTWNATLDFLKNISEKSSSAEEIFPSTGKLLLNTHIHLPPNFSAFDNVSQAVELAAEQGIRILGAGNYYDYTVYDEFSALCQQAGIFPLFGTEVITLEEEMQKKGVRVNDPGNYGKCYICGKGITKFTELCPKAKELINIIRYNDNKRTLIMADKMSELFRGHNVETELNQQAIIERIIKRHNCSPKAITLQERHLSQAFQEVFFDMVPAEKRLEKLKQIFGTSPRAEIDNPVAVQNEIRSNLMKAGKCCYVAETFVNPCQAKELILSLGGIPCYPVIADAAKPICEYEATPDVLIKNLKAEKYTMVEFIPVRNAPDVLAEYVRALRSEGFAVVAGTEHNTLDMLPIEPRCSGGKAIPQDLIEIFTEGAFVLAAHQYLSANDKCGFVDENGNPNPDYETAEDRIKAFAKTGQGVLNNYFNKEIN